jgi:tetratricopeptide (TPR) repeat protein
MNEARIMYARKNYRESLQLYQRILRLSPNTQPDPRIGIGLCFWQLGEKAKAKKAWERSLELVRTFRSNNFAPFRALLSIPNTGFPNSYSVSKL